METIGNRLNAFVLKVMRELRAMTKVKRSHSPESSSDEGQSHSDSDDSHSCYKSTRQKKRCCSSHKDHHCCEELVIKKDRKHKSGLQLGAEVSVRIRIT